MFSCHDHACFVQLLFPFKSARGQIKYTQGRRGEAVQITADGLFGTGVTSGSRKHQ